MGIQDLRDRVRKVRWGEGYVRGIRGGGWYGLVCSVANGSSNGEAGQVNTVHYV